MNKLKQTGLVLLSASMLGLSSCKNYDQQRYNKFVEECGSKGELVINKTIHIWNVTDESFTMNYLREIGPNKYKGFQIVDKAPFNSVDQTNVVTMRYRHNKPYIKTTTTTQTTPEKVASTTEHFKNTLKSIMMYKRAIE